MKKKVICIISYLLFMTLLTGCVREFEIIGYEFGVFPRIVYIANVDAELDYSDVTLVAIQRNGNRSERPLDYWATIEHSIDFTIPGIYQVEVVISPKQEFRFPFFVIVIDEATFNQLKVAEPSWLCKFNLAPTRNNLSQ